MTPASLLLHVVAAFLMIAVSACGGSGPVDSSEVGPGAVDSCVLLEPEDVEKVARRPILERREGGTCTWGADDGKMPPFVISATVVPDAEDQFEENKELVEGEKELRDVGDDAFFTSDELARLDFIENGYWVTAALPFDELDARAVKQIGQTMAGNVPD